MKITSQIRGLNDALALFFGGLGRIPHPAGRARPAFPIIPAGHGVRQLLPVNRSKQLRVLLLLIVLGLVAHAAVSDRTRIASWNNPLFVGVYPVNSDGSAVAERYIQGLREADFQPVAEAAAREAARYGLELDRPFYIELGAPIDDPPPQPPANGSVIERMQWALRARLWRWRFDDQGLDPDVIVIALYRDPAQYTGHLHSVGVERVRVARVNLFASRARQGENQVVLLHEILHTVGARDKYDPGTGLPLYPTGYAEPARNPRYPQQAAEIMAGRIPVAPGQARQAASLDRIVVGPETAREIGWLKD